MINQISDPKPEFSDTFDTDSVYSNEQTTMNSATATMNDLVVTMGGFSPLNQYEAPEAEINSIVDTKP